MPNDIEYYRNVLKEIQGDVFKDYADGWKGRNGCLCSQCWEKDGKGTYKQWLKLFKKISKEWDKFTKDYRSNLNNE